MSGEVRAMILTPLSALRKELAGNGEEQTLHLFRVSCHFSVRSPGTPEGTDAESVRISPGNPTAMCLSLHYLLQGCALEEQFSPV